ncbi:MAG: hypothetical protein BWY71_00799 [Planctomycetes bacterium ADurb.Bin412]|nr:MAG: hypothetical protein BWY71_00799 [Planctomycetes bacterium ADurb.Bin412]
MKTIKRSCRGGSSVLAIIFVTLFSVLAISFTAMSNMNVQMSRNHRDLVLAQAAAESGLQYARYLVNSYVPPAAAYSPRNTVTAEEAASSFGYFVTHVQTLLDGSPILAGQGIYQDLSAGLLQVPASGAIGYVSDGTATFSLRFEFVAGDEDNPHRMIVTSTGFQDQLSRTVRLSFPIQKNSSVLQYAIAGRGRLWLTGDCTVDGDIFSSWDRVDLSPFNVTADSHINGTINTVLTLDQVLAQSWQMETLDEDGNPVFDENGDRVYSTEDEVQGYHEGINYGQQDMDMPGMDIADYDTSAYKAAIPTTIRSGTASLIADGILGKTGVPTVTEYFPHAAGNCGQAVSGSQTLTRYKYENKTLRNVRVAAGTQALFKNCTFEEVLYVDCSTSGPTSTASTYNNIRFDNCTFNGTIITNVPQALNSNWWKKNCLYFTGSATFQNNSSVPEATILAPHFNVNLGNTNPVEGDTNQLTGAIVGGIVDIRGNAEIHGTIISMSDTTSYTSGYVTNVGATLGDGGSETTEPGDVGVIHITPDPDKMLPSGIQTPIVILSDGNSYVEL